MIKKLIKNEYENEKQEDIQKSPQSDSQPIFGSEESKRRIRQLFMLLVKSDKRINPNYYSNK